MDDDVIEGEYHATTRDRSAEREALFQAVCAKGWWPVGLLIGWRLWIICGGGLDAVNWWLRRRGPRGGRALRGLRQAALQSPGWRR